jgi:hypothetical protein
LLVVSGLVRRVRNAVSDAGRVVDYRGRSEFAPQAAHGHHDGAGEGVGVFIPDLFEQVFGAQDRG